MATIAVLAWLTPLMEGSGGWVTSTAPIMNIMEAIQKPPATKLFLRPKRSMPMYRNMAVATTLTVP